MMVCGVTAALNPNTLPAGLTTGTLQVYVVPGGAVAGVILKLVPLQIMVDWLAMGGSGTPTTAVSVKGAPVQPVATGVMVYTTWPVAAVVFTRVCEIVDTGVVCWPPLITEPNGNTTGVGQVYVVLAGTGEGSMLNGVPEQMVSVILKRIGTGLTGTVTVKVLPAHPLVEGVTV